MQKRKLKVLLAKVGFDGHDRGVKILASVFRDAGYDVVYIGKYLTVEDVVNAAIDEDVDVVGLSFLGGSHITYCRDIIQLMEDEGLDGCSLIIGGVIPMKDFQPLRDAGVSAIFSANTRTTEITGYLDKYFEEKCCAEMSGEPES